jgi:hypothetical protein
MRVTQKSANEEFAVRAIAGTHTVMMAMNCPDHRRKGLRGFAFRRDVVGDASPGRWLRSLKVFKSVVPDPKKLVNGKPQSFTTDKHPVQSFLWSDYTARPATEYRFKIVPMYGTPKNLQPLDDGAVELTVKTEPEDDPAGHGVWFNRGAIASLRARVQQHQTEPPAARRREPAGHAVVVPRAARGVPALHQ